MRTFYSVIGRFSRCESQPPEARRDYKCGVYNGARPSSKTSELFALAQHLTKSNIGRLRSWSRMLRGGARDHGVPPVPLPKLHHTDS